MRDKNGRAHATALDEALDVWEDALEHAHSPLVTHGDAATT